MQYMLLIYQNEAGWGKQLRRGILPRRPAPTCAYTEAIGDAGVLRGGRPAVVPPPPPPCAS